MSELLLIHRPSGQEISPAKGQALGEESNSYLVWKTCLRQIVFLERQNLDLFSLQENDEIFLGLEAESFLGEVLCGLKSPLLGETEVFGQFKLWWKALAANEPLKLRHQGRIEGLYSLVKSVREKVLCGQGSQSYGSLLRRFLRDNSSVDVVGAGHLAQEIIPWIQGKSSVRIWCRNPDKVRDSEFAQVIGPVLSLQETETLTSAVVVAAPMNHAELNSWLQERGFSREHALFDFRADSQEFQPFLSPRQHLKLGDFFKQYEEHQSGIQKKAEDARQMIRAWKDQQESKAQVRPYGWEDL